MIPTIIIASIIGIAVCAIVINEIKKRKNGKSSCSCGCNCGACGLCPSKSDEDKG